ncbi:glycosyltransferase group 2 [Candidatus Williamhamiltonella defendens]|uniref:Glycosyltransferase group 2 n=1 Tax=Hamiltonella defensa subsp. Acyrthosiphon pisum (strain 5AT) TaxID=572265 RepID=C4K314_HAMD5|nr:glycosyltransferase [Candidatus Hamiltonella defensa]ACQ66957.1 glycosyltransferase group 2 [Candidatus Hamiltonella defensa 5AT (Acyrthosiphon pisum)]ATW21754.1 glycosyltransferase group 2 [Candidatus Hamiltonella defensa]
MQPLVSIIVPTFNESINVLEASLKSLFKQTFRNFECIVVDDSTDLALADFCKQLCLQDSRFIYVKQPNRLGLAASLNLALQKARGDWVARFDADDICMPDRLAQQIEFLSKNKDIDVLGGAVEIVDDSLNRLGFKFYPKAHNDIIKKSHFINPLAHPTVMFKRDLVLNLGGYDTTFKYAEDLELWLRLINKGIKFANLDKILIQYRQSTLNRAHVNWRFNLKARIKNFKLNYFIRRVSGIVMIGCWAFLPKKIYEFIYKALMLRPQ